MQIIICNYYYYLQLFLFSILIVTMNISSINARYLEEPVSGGYPFLTREKKNVILILPFSSHQVGAIPLNIFLSSKISTISNLHTKRFFSSKKNKKIFVRLKTSVFNPIHFSFVSVSSSFSSSFSLISPSFFFQ